MEHVGVLVVLALRNLRRHLRRTLLTASAMIIGGALLMFSLSLGDGTHESWIDSGVRMGSGHVTVEAPDFRRSRKIEDRLGAEARAAAEQALQAPGIAEQVTTISAKLVINGMASSPAGARPAQIMGVDPPAEAAFSTLDEQVVEGRYLEPDDRLAAYVGVGLAESLDLRLGSRLVVTAQDTHKEIAGQLVRVVGVFRTGVPEIDQALIHMPLDTAGEWLDSGRD
ncbi:MAG: ABC transporter permease, partial [Vicinamibacterales bacterium]|nr:ABC transporter permease [Vicinamibacterales bacterium]